MTSSPINIIPVPMDTSETLIKLQAVSLEQGEMGDKTLAPDNLLEAVTARLKKMLLEERAINADWRAQQDRLAEKTEKLVEKVVRAAPDTTPICAAFNNMVKALVPEIKMANTAATKSKESSETLAKEVEKLAMIVEQQQQKIQQLADVVRNCSQNNQRNSRTDDNLPHKRAKLDKGANTYLKSCYICRKDHSAEECTMYRDGETRHKAMIDRKRCTRCTRQALENHNCVYPKGRKCVHCGGEHLNALCTTRYPKISTEEQEAIYTRVMQLTIPSTEGPEGQSKQQ